MGGRDAIVVIDGEGDVLGDDPGRIMEAMAIGAAPTRVTMKNHIRSVGPGFSAMAFLADRRDRSRPGGGRHRGALPAVAPAAVEAPMARLHPDCRGGWR